MLYDTKIYAGAECTDIEISTLSGWIECKILPPRELFHPIIPHKKNEKLSFILSRTCGKISGKECHHSDEERAITGTWIIEEVTNGIEMGYQILEIFEIWEYDIM